MSRTAHSWICTDSFGRVTVGYFLPLGPVYRRDAGLQLGDMVAVTLMPEGPQSKALAADIVAALEAEPDAARFFDGLATFYRKNYLRWIDATKRNPSGAPNGSPSSSS